MTPLDNEKSIYIAISQTGTFLSRVIKFISRKEYNHASISPYEDLHLLYSFGRLRPYNPILGGFVVESAEFGTFKRFSKTRVVVLKINVEDSVYNDFCEFIDYMIENSDDYGYNYLGLCLAAFKICFKAKNRYYCSEFVRDTLIKHNIEGADRLERIVHPCHFFELPNYETVFTGLLKDYKQTSSSLK